MTTVKSTEKTHEAGTPDEFDFVRDRTYSQEVTEDDKNPNMTTSYVATKDSYVTHAEGDEAGGVDQFSNYTKDGTTSWTSDAVWNPTGGETLGSRKATRHEEGSGPRAPFTVDVTVTGSYISPPDAEGKTTTTRQPENNWTQHTDGTLDIATGQVLTQTVTGGPPVGPGPGWWDKLTDSVASGVASGLDVVTFGYSTQVLASATFGTVLDGTDQFFAGAASGLTGGLSNRVREQLYGQEATKNHQGALYNVGSVVGTGLGIAVSFGNPCGMATAAKVAFKALNVAQAAGGSINAVENVKKGNYLSAALDVVGVVGNIGAFGKACFAAGVPLLTPMGDKLIEKFQPGDLILSRSEWELQGELEAKVVEEVFVNTAQILNMHVGGQVIRTTAEHPFWVRDKGWLAANELKVGDLLNSHDGQWMPIEDLLDTGEFETVYNLRIEDYHTYFVGNRAWQFSVWAHNKCAGYHHMVPVSLGSKIPYGHKFLTWFNAADHTALHTGLSAFLRTQTKTVAGKVIKMLPGPGNPGAAVIRNFTRTERLSTLVQFYKSFQGGKFYTIFLNELRNSFKAGAIV